MNLTQWLGLISFGMAGLLCLQRRTSAWVSIGLINVLYGAECAMGLRHQLHNFAVAAMGTQYGARTLWQTGMILGALSSFVIISGIIFRTNKFRGIGLALYITIISGIVFALETISLHDVDKVLYQPTGPALLIGWLWLVLAMITGFSASYSDFRTATDKQT